MTLNARLLALNLPRQNTQLSAVEVIPLIDLTRLNEHATADEIHKLAIKAEKHRVAAVCVYPEHLDFISPDITIKRATVVNFPSGDQPHSHVTYMLEKIIADKQVDEIDYVFPYTAYLQGNQAEAIAHCHDIFQVCRKNNLIFKVIIESGTHPSLDTVYKMSTDIIHSGCDFLKTSTGKQSVGATIPAVFAMLAAITDNHSTCGIKVSGGISTPEQAFAYMKLAQIMLNRSLDSHCFRIGSSALIDVFHPNLF